MARSPAGSAAFDGVLFYKYTLNTFPEPPSMSIGSWRRILTWAYRGALMTKGPELLAEAPQIEHVDVLAAKIPH